jgi:hypothetical protein
MGVNQAPGLVLQVHVAQHGNQDRVLQNIRMIAGVKGVSIGEHPPMVP